MPRQEIAIPVAIDIFGMLPCQPFRKGPETSASAYYIALAKECGVTFFLELRRP